MADSVWVPIVSAGAALGGVWLGDLLQRSREHKAYLAEVRRAALVDLYAWAMKVQEVLDRLQCDLTSPKEGSSNAAELPALSPELQARTYIYVHPLLGTAANKAALKVRKLTSRVSELRQEEVVGLLIAVTDLTGQLQGMIQQYAVVAEEPPTARLISRLRQLLRRPSGTTRGPGPSGL